MAFRQPSRAFLFGPLDRRSTMHMQVRAVNLTFLHARYRDALLGTENVICAPTIFGASWQHDGLLISEERIVASDLDLG